eukprot:TRINITY_DN2358_c0_g1_i6.p1 TRINITY_DN2358_c0_g1~~TRINITY_DN2358_c0_g1_i6.p1  ORF type:complete len:224 (+),score=4.14 TRINITY_DN2358_c0_g1_i6:136-807(+)
MCIRDSLIFLSIRHNQKKQQVIMLVYFPSYFISMFAQQHHYEPNILLRMKKNIHLIMDLIFYFICLKQIFLLLFHLFYLNMLLHPQMKFLIIIAFHQNKKQYYYVLFQQQFYHSQELLILSLYLLNYQLFLILFHFLKSILRLYTLHYWLKTLYYQEQQYLMYIDLFQQYKHLSLIHISEPTRPLYISYAVFCLKKKKKKTIITVPYYLYTVHTTITIRKRQR